MRGGGPSIVSAARPWASREGGNREHRTRAESCLPSPGTPLARRRTGCAPPLAVGGTPPPVRGVRLRRGRCGRTRGCCAGRSGANVGKLRGSRALRGRAHRATRDDRGARREPGRAPPPLRGLCMVARMGGRRGRAVIDVRVGRPSVSEPLRRTLHARWQNGRKMRRPRAVQPGSAFRATRRGRRSRRNVRREALSPPVRCRWCAATWMRSRAM